MLTSFLYPLPLRYVCLCVCVCMCMCLSGENNWRREGVEKRKFPLRTLHHSSLLILIFSTSDDSQQLFLNGLQVVTWIAFRSSSSCDWEQSYLYFSINSSRTKSVTHMLLLNILWLCFMALGQYKEADQGIIVFLNEGH